MCQKIFFCTVMNIIFFISSMDPRNNLSKQIRELSFSGDQVISFLMKTVPEVETLFSSHEFLKQRNLYLETSIEELRKNASELKEAFNKREAEFQKLHMVVTYLFNQLSAHTQQNENDIRKIHVQNQEFRGEIDELKKYNKCQESTYKQFSTPEQFLSDDIINKFLGDS